MLHVSPNLFFLYLLSTLFLAASLFKKTLLRTLSVEYVVLPPVFYNIVCKLIWIRA